jgi:hypothetical protein
MNKKSLVLLLLMLCAPGIRAEDYQYQYFKEKDKGKYTPFSDYIPQIRLHYQTVPHYLEDYYLLYGLKQHYNENTLRKNIERLKTALNCRFRHPSMALVKVESEKEYLKYRNLMFMHINLLIMRNHLTIASRYDKRKIYFYNKDFAKDIDESLSIADKYYAEAMPYWTSAKEYANKASNIKIPMDMGFIESERYSIVRGDLDFGKIISDYRKDIKTKKQKLGETAPVRRQAISDK